MKFLASTKLAIGLLITLVALSVIGMSIPQEIIGTTGYTAWKLRYPEIAPIIELLQFNKVFNSVWIKIIFTLFFVNIFSCTYLQARQLAKGRRQPGSGPVYKTLPAPGTGYDWREHSTSFLKSKRYQVTTSNDAGGSPSVVGTKYRFSQWAAVLFHVGLLVVILGVFTSILGIMDGLIPLMEGQQVFETQENYVLLDKGPLSGSHTGLPLRMNKITVEIDRSKRDINLIKNQVSFGDSQFSLESKNPVTVRGFTFYRDKFGYTLTVATANQSTPAEEITFPLLSAPGNSNTYNNQANIPGLPFTLNVTLYPDALKNPRSSQQLYTTRGPALLNPVLEIEAGTAAPEQTAFLKPGDPFEWRGTKLKLIKIGAWSSLRLVRDPGVNLIYSGFAISVFSLALMYLIIPREVFIRELSNGLLEIGGSTSRFRHLFRDELAELYNVLDRRC